MPKRPNKNLKKILNRVVNGEYYSDIGKRYGITRQQVSKIAIAHGIHRNKRSNITNQHTKELYGKKHKSNSGD